MFGLRSQNAIQSEIDTATDEINRLIARVSELRKEDGLASSLTDIQAILENQPIGGVTRNGEPAEPLAVIQEHLGKSNVSLYDCMEVRETYTNLRKSLKVRAKNVALFDFGEESLSPLSVMRQVYASKVLRELLRYRENDIGKFVSIDKHGYVSVLKA